MSIEHILKVFCLAILVLLLLVGLGPAKWQPRSGLGWELDHFAGYFVITLMFCLAWRGSPYSVLGIAGGAADHSTGPPFQSFCGLVPQPGCWPRSSLLKFSSERDAVSQGQKWPENSQGAPGGQPKQGNLQGILRIPVLPVDWDV
jgi:hypothetical protein